MAKALVLVVVAAFAVASCNSFSKQHAGTYGQTFDTAHAVNVSQAVAKTSAQPMPAVVKGTVTSSCKKEGCWMKLDAGNGSDLFVSTEEKFFVPKENMTGKTVYVSGETFLDTTTVEQLRDYAKDEGKSEDEINKINEPKVEVSMRATGVKVL